MKNKNFYKQLKIINESKNNAIIEFWQIKAINLSETGKIHCLKYSGYKFVILNITKYNCIRCGECCKAVRAIAKKKYKEGCIHLKQNNICKINNLKPTACKTFPFHVMNYENNNDDILMLFSACSGYGKGQIINNQRYGEILINYNKEIDKNDKKIVDMKINYIPLSNRYIIG